MKHAAPFYLILLSLLISCQKEPISQKVSFSKTAYDLLSEFDSAGKPNALLKDNVSQGLKDFLNSILVNGEDLSKTRPELFTNPEIADIAIKKTSDVFLTFVQQQGIYTNAIGFYTYPTGTVIKKASDIKKITYCFPNAGNGTALTAGDKVKLGTFSPGTSIGFVLLASAWNPLTAKLDNKAVHFCSNDALNPERDPKLKKHAVLIPYPAENKVLIGFEDIDRTNSACDHDFDDVVLYTTVVEK